MGNDLKKWTVLHYANGHNELEPEIWQSILNIQDENVGEHLNVVAQVTHEQDTWGVTHYPDERYLLSILGHVYFERAYS